MLIKRNLVVLFYCAVAVLMMAAGCEFPYAPAPLPDSAEEELVTQSDSGGVGSGVLYRVNKEQQTCNPSISPSDVYPACMLWLGFDALSVTVPESLSGYDDVNVAMHDRLTVVDTANTVRWYIMIDELNENGELQCPEWSTHPDYLACLTGTIAKPYSGHAVRFSDRKSLKLCNRTLGEFSTPHLWVSDSVNSDGTVTAPVYNESGVVKKEHVREFFGTTRVKFIYTLLQQSGVLYYVDYSVSGNPEPVPLNKPEGLEDWYCHSPLISPDGQWVTYHCFPNSAQGAYYRSFIQRLTPRSQPVLIADKASDPHWWVDRDNDRYYIVYTVTRGAYFSEYEYNDAELEASGDAGATLIQRLAGTWRDVPDFLGTLAPDPSFSPYTLIQLPFKGGLSRDGRFLCTAYKYAYLLELQ